VGWIAVTMHSDRTPTSAHHDARSVLQPLNMPRGFGHRNCNVNLDGRRWDRPDPHCESQGGDRRLQGRAQSPPPPLSTGLPHPGRVRCPMQTCSPPRDLQHQLNPEQRQSGPRLTVGVVGVRDRRGYRSHPCCCCGVSELAAFWSPDAVCDRCTDRGWYSKGAEPGCSCDRRATCPHGQAAAPTAFRRGPLGHSSR
jgi:hypothetical protein